MVQTGDSSFNFHIFYYLLYGESQKQLDQWRLELAPVEKYEYLRPLPANAELNCKEGLRDFKEAFLALGGSEEEMLWLFQVIAVILHLGNLDFTERKGPKSTREKSVVITNREELDIIARLLAVHPTDLEDSLTFSDTAPATSRAADNNRDELAMICFAMIASFLQEIANQHSKTDRGLGNLTHIGLFDICGINREEETAGLGLAEFLTNYTNEKMRKVFYQNYLESSPVEFQDNEGCVQLSEDLCHLLRDESLKSSGSSRDFINKVEHIVEANPAGTMAAHGDLRVDHYSGSVTYRLAGWYETIHRSSEEASNELLKLLGNSVAATTFLKSVDTGRLHQQVTGTFYMNQLQTLVQSLQATPNAFVYCLRHPLPAEGLESAVILPQLKSHGIVELAEIAQYTQRGAEEALDFCNTFPGGKKSKQSKKRLFDKPRNKSSPNTSTAIPRAESRDNMANCPTSPRKRSKSIKNIIRTKSRAIKGEEKAVLRSSVSRFMDSETSSASKLKSSTSLSSQSVTQTLSGQISPGHRRGNSTGDSVSFPEEGEIESDSSDDESLVLSDDELSEVSADDEEASDNLRLLPEKQTLSNRQLFDRQRERVSKFQTSQELANQMEAFCWKDDQQQLLRVDSAKQLHALSQIKLHGNLQQPPTPQEQAARREKFESTYKCGSLLRTLHQRDASPDSAVEYRFGLMDYDSPLKRANSASAGLGSGVVPHSSSPRSNSLKGNSKVKIDASAKRNTDKADSQDDELAGSDNCDDDVDKSWLPELVQWSRKSTRIQRLSVHLAADSIDDTVNQITFSNPIQPSPRRQKNMIDFNSLSGQTLTFVTYAMSHFKMPKKMEKYKPGSSKYKSKIKKMTSYVKIPLPEPLLPLRSRTLQDCAVDNFKHILCFMFATNKLMSDTQAEPVGEDGAFKSLLHAATIIRNGLQYSSLRDEIYCQLIKQSTANPKEQHVIRIWELLAFCSGCFAPSPNFYKYLTKHFDAVAEEQSGEIGAWASYCKDRIVKVSEMGKRFFVPTDAELLAVQKRKPMMQVFHFLDGKQKQVPIYSSTTAMESLEFLLQMVGLKDAEGYMVYESYQLTSTARVETTLRSLLYSELLCNSLSKFRELETSYRDKNVTLTTSFVIKRKLFLSPRLPPADPVEVRLQFHQTAENIRNGSLLVKERDALVLCALEQQILFGDFNPERKPVVYVLTLTIQHDV